jgi:hypothetical protein
MTFGTQLVPQLREIVNLSIEDNALGAVLVEHGLRAAFQIDDAQSAMAEPYTGRDKDPAAVGAAMAQRGE